MMAEKTIDDYDIIEADNLQDLISAVKEKISEGWQPFQLVAVRNDMIRKMFLQVMVKHESIL